MAGPWGHGAPEDSGEQLGEEASQAEGGRAAFAGSGPRRWPHGDAAGSQQGHLWRGRPGRSVGTEGLRTMTHSSPCLDAGGPALQGGTGPPVLGSGCCRPSQGAPVLTSVTQPSVPRGCPPLRRVALGPRASLLRGHSHVGLGTPLVAWFPLGGLSEDPVPTAATLGHAWGQDGDIFVEGDQAPLPGQGGRGGAGPAACGSQLQAIVTGQNSPLVTPRRSAGPRAPAPR